MGKSKATSSLWAGFSRGLTLFLYATALASGLVAGGRPGARKEADLCLIPHHPPILYPPQVIHSPEQNQTLGWEELYELSIKSTPSQPEPDLEHGIQMYECAIKYKENMKSIEYFDYLVKHYASKNHSDHPYKNQLPFHENIFHISSPTLPSSPMPDTHFILTLHQMIKEHTDKIDRHGPHRLFNSALRVQRAYKGTTDPYLAILRLQESLLLWASEIAKMKIAKNDPTLIESLFLNSTVMNMMTDTTDEYSFSHPDSETDEELQNRINPMIVYRLYHAYQKHYLQQGLPREPEPINIKTESSAALIELAVGAVTLTALISYKRFCSRKPILEPVNELHLTRQERRHLERTVGRAFLQIHKQ